MSLTQEIEARIQAFVADLNTLVRKEALEAVASALGTGSAPAALRRGPGRPRKSAPNGAPRPLRASTRRKGQKRPPSELANIQSALAEHVKANEGQGIEAISKALGLPTRELARPMKKLIAAGAVKTTGQKRATKYFVGSGEASTSKKRVAVRRARAAKGKVKRNKKKA